MESDVDRVRAQKRRVIKQRPMEPLDPERRYVQPDRANLSVTPDVFSRIRFPGRGGRVKVERKRGGEGFAVPTHHSREKARFNQYFELGTGIKLRPGNVNWELNVFRNRVLFVGALAGMFLYFLYWISR